MKLISLYTGCGGLDLGFEAAGFRTAVAVEMDAAAVTTLQANRPWTVIDRDIHHVTSAELMAVVGLREGEAAALVGGPPCQPFSKAGYWVTGATRRLEDPRAGTLAAYLRVLRDTLPETFLIENVAGLAFNGKSEGLDFLRRGVAEINEERGTDYTFAVAKLNALQYGAPQSRERVFIVGARDGRSFSFPEIALTRPEQYRTAWDAIGDLEDDDDPSLRLTGKWAGLLPSIPEGENYLYHTERGGGLPLFRWRGRYWNFLLKLAKNRPSWTIPASPGPATGPFHWKSRRLSVRELCRLQTFPDAFKIVGNLRAAQKQIGNAVPPLLAEVVASEIRRQLLGGRMSFAISATNKAPSAEPCAEVPEHFLEDAA